MKARLAYNSSPCCLSLQCALTTILIKILARAGEATQALKTPTAFAKDWGWVAMTLFQLLTSICNDSSRGFNTLGWVSTLMCMHAHPRTNDEKLNHP